MVQLKKGLNTSATVSASVHAGFELHVRMTSHASNAEQKLTPCSDQDEDLTANRAWKKEDISVPLISRLCLSQPFLQSSVLVPRHLSLWFLFFSDMERFQLGGGRRYF